jgi:phytoene synthase
VDDPHLDPALAVALAWQPRASRPALASLFELDRRLGDALARAQEPLLAQVRLAWWRDRLIDQAGYHSGEPLLKKLADRWGERRAMLRELVDGWENLLGDAPLPASAINAFAAGRGRALAAFTEVAGDRASAASAEAAGRCWAFADLAWRSSDDRERELARSLGLAVDLPALRSRELRGVEVLKALAQRALVRNEPLMQGRGAALAAMRVGMVGR